MRLNHAFAPTALTVLMAASAAVADDRWSGFVELEVRGYGSEPAHQGQSGDDSGSLAAEPEFSFELRERNELVLFTPFVRIDSVDDNRTHFDLRELSWQKAFPNWEVLAGVSKVFWGVTESQHLVDIINQTDLVENPDGEDKLGQPMVRLSLVRGWGILDLYTLPGFRERTFPGAEGRLRPEIPIDTDRALYESGAGRYHVDFAARWSHVLGPVDLGLSHFHGTSRDPRFVPSADAEASLSLVPLYEQIDQSGLEVQATLGGWLLKLEAIHRRGQGDPYSAATGGFEYTLWGAFGSKIDVGVLTEYLWDERGEGAFDGLEGGSPTPFEDDVFLGTRLGFNDAASTQVLAGVIFDRSTSAAAWRLEADRRIASSWTIDLEMRAVTGVEVFDPLSAFQADDYFQVSLRRHF